MDNSTEECKMRKVYQVMGLGFGDDEDAWELCSTHETRAGADEAREVILADGCEVEWVRIDEVEVAA
jgi:hypothetical protein